MKNVLLVVMVMAVSLGYSQETGVNANNNSLGALAAYGSDGANIGASSLVINPPRPIEGTVYIFDGWNNNAVIETGSDKNFRLRNINFNAKRNAFESKISSDSIFTFDFTNIEKMTVQNRSFKNVYSPVDGGYRVYEVIAETDDFTIYKNYTIDIKEGNPNPMLAQANDKYVMRDNYFIKKGKSFKKFRLKKSDFLKVLGKKSDQVEQYAKENRLSFKDERHVNKMAIYYASL